MKSGRLLKSNKRTLVAIALFGAMLFIGERTFETNKVVAKLRDFDNGNKVCMGRVKQAYTARVINDRSSDYLQNSFMQTTEECFADLVLEYEENFQDILASSETKLNSLSADVHWFHQKLMQGNGTLSGNGKFNAIVENVNERFGKIEGNAYDISDDIISSINEIENSTQNYRTILFGLVTLLPLVLIYDLVARFRRRLIDLELEDSAQNEMLSSDTMVTGRVEDIVTRALQGHQLWKCSQLFTTYHARLLEGKNGGFVSPRPYIEKFSTEELGIQNRTITESVLKTGNLAYLNSGKSSSSTDRKSVVTENPIYIEYLNSAIKTDNCVSIDEIVTKVLDMFTSKIFSKGIKLNLDFEDDLWVKGEQEAIEQVIYQALGFVINRVEKEDQELILRLRNFQRRILLSFTLTGNCYDLELVKNPYSSLEMQICSDLLRDYATTFTLENVRIDSASTTESGRLAFVFVSASKDRGLVSKMSKLVNLKRGPKKEIMAELQSA